MINKNILKGSYKPLGGGLRVNSLEYAEAIGNYLLNYSQLEYEIIKAISYLVNENTDELGFSIVAYIRNVPTKWKLLKDWLKNSGYEEEVEKWGKMFPKYFKFRNKLVHAIWPSLDSDGLVDVAIESDGEIYIKKEKITVDKIFEVNDEMCEAIWEFEEFLKDLGVEL